MYSYLLKTDYLPLMLIESARILLGIFFFLSQAVGKDLINLEYY